ncbi:MAG TPA: transcriptional regulator NrdR [Bacillota bacterium]|nr:transcriptional regulator NrdR [Bacillota bacterium]
MHCPYCGYPESKVVDSRASDEGSAIRRRRECLSCERRFTTYERVEEAPLVVVKRDGRREPFDRQKIMNGLLKACEKRTVSFETIDRITDQVERELRNRMEQEVPSTVIGELIMEALRSIDEVAYVRFASVYRQFKDVDKFLQELQALMEQKRDS